MTNNVQTLAAISGNGILPDLVIAIARQPLILLAVPVVILFPCMAAVSEELPAAWFGMLNIAGIFDPAVLSDPERAVLAGRRDYFWFGAVVSAAARAGVFTVPLRISLAEKTESLLSFIIAAMLFLLIFIFLPKLIRKG